MDAMAVLEKYGYPVLTALVMGKVCWNLFTMIFNEFNRQRTEWAQDKKDLVSELKAERAAKDSKVMDVVMGYAKDHDDTTEMLGRAEMLLKDMLSRRGTWPEKSQ